MILFQRLSAFVCLLFVGLLSSSAFAQSEGTPEQNLDPGPYTVRPNLNNAACMDVSGASPSNGTSVQSWSCNSTIAQVWSLAPVKIASGTAYQLVSAISGSCLDVDGVSLQDGGLIHEWQCLGASQSNQLWQIYPFGNSYELVSVNSGKCLDMTAGNTANGVQLQQWGCSQGQNPNQLWNLGSNRSEGTPAQSLASGPYTIKPSSTAAACMDISGGSSNNGSTVQSWACNGTAAQTWSLAPVQIASGTVYQVVSSISGSCLDVSGVSLADGALLHEWQCLGAGQTNQLWQMYPVGSFYELVSVNSGKCLDLTGASSASGSPLQQWTCAGGSDPSELWNLVSLVPSSAGAGSSGTTGGGLSGVVTSSSSSSTTTGDSSSTVAASAPATTSTIASSTTTTSDSTTTTTTTTTSASSGEQAVQADAFVDSVGVNTHLTYQNTPYASAWPSILSSLKALGVRHIRDGFSSWPTGSPFYTEHQTLASAGIKTDYVFSIDNTVTPQLVQTFASMTEDMESIEAPNECDAAPNCGGGNLAGVNNVASFMQTMAAIGHALNTPVVGPSFTTDAAYAEAGQLSSTVTYNNIHVYFGGRNPGSAGWGGGDAEGNNYGSFAWWIDQAHVDAPSAPVIATETGYIAYPQTSAPYTLPESVEASYIPRTLATAFNEGVKRTYVYELLDEISSPGYGLLRSDLSAKPAYTAIKNLLGTLTDPGATFTPGKLNYTVSGADTTLSHMLLQKRDGTFWLVLWLEKSSYNPVTNVAIPVTSQNVTLSISGGLAVEQVLQMDSTGAENTVVATGSTISMPLNDQMTLIEIGK